MRTCLPFTLPVLLFTTALLLNLGCSPRTPHRSRPAPYAPQTADTPLSPQAPTQSGSNYYLVTFYREQAQRPPAAGKTPEKRNAPDLRKHNTAKAVSLARTTPAAVPGTVPKTSPGAVPGIQSPPRAQKTVPRPHPGRLVLGSERLFEPEYFKLIAGKNIAVMANQTARHTVNRLIADPRVHLAAIFAPEHGFDGEHKAGADVPDTFYRGVPVYGRYGGGDETRRIPPDLLKGIDVLLFEVQDLGTRHYTFISSMYLAMDSAADVNIPFIVLDRPVGVNGVQVEGPLLDPRFQTFIGVGRLPNRYAMTIGELALLFKNEAGLMNGPRYPRAKPGDAYYNVKDLNLTVVPMKHYNRRLYFDEIYGGDKWVRPSPNIPNVQAAVCYVGTGLLNGNSIREMVAGYNQFDHISFPFIKDRAEMRRFLSFAAGQYDFPGLTFRILPDKKTGIANVVFLEVTDRLRFNATLTILALMYTQAVLYPDVPFLTSARAEHMFTISQGNSWFLGLLRDRKHLPEFKAVIARTDRGMREFMRIRKKYLLY